MVKTLIMVGEKYPLFQKGTISMQGQDGGLLEALEDGDGLWFHLYLNHPHPKEIQTFRTAKVHVRLVQEEDFVLPLVRFGSALMIYEMSFDPTLYPDARAFQITDTNNLLSMVLIDSSNGVVNAVRQANLPLKFIQICKEKWAKACLDSEYSIKYKKWYDKLQQIPLEHVWERAMYVGKLGETYNLEEIQYRQNSDFYRS